LDSSGLEAAVAGDERKAKAEGSCCDDAVGHVSNNVAEMDLSALAKPDHRAAKTPLLIIRWIDQD